MFSVSLDPERVALLLSPLTSKLDARPPQMFAAVQRDTQPVQHLPPEGSVVASYEPPPQTQAQEIEVVGSEEVEDAEDAEDPQKEPPVLFVDGSIEIPGMTQVVESIPLGSHISGDVTVNSKAVILHNLLTPYSPSEGDKSTDGRWVIMDWAVDDRLFTVENYKALESVLTVYPSSPVRVVLVHQSYYSHLLPCTDLIYVYRIRRLPPGMRTRTRPVTSYPSCIL